MAEIGHFGIVIIINNEKLRQVYDGPCLATATPEKHRHKIGQHLFWIILDRATKGEWLMVEIAALIDNQTAKWTAWNRIFIDVLDLIRTNHQVFFHHFVLDGTDSHVLKFPNHEPICKYPKLDKQIAAGKFSVLLFAQFWSIEPLHEDIEDLVVDVVKVNGLRLGLNEAASESSPEDWGVVNGKLLMDLVGL
jgi:hypothetical protein